MAHILKSAKKKKKLYKKRNIFKNLKETMSAKGNFTFFVDISLEKTNLICSNKRQISSCLPSGVDGRLTGMGFKNFFFLSDVTFHNVKWWLYSKLIKMYT